MEDIDALALLKEEMETEEVHLKVNAIHRLKTVILCIGVEDTIKKLIPYLESMDSQFWVILFHRFGRQGGRWGPIRYRWGVRKSLVSVLID